MSAILQTMHWAVRILALFLAGLVVLLAFGEGVSLPEFDRGETGMLAALFVSVTGLVLLAVPPYAHQKRILAGGILNLLGIGTLYLINFRRSGRFPGGWVFPLFFVPGVFELIMAFIRTGSHSLQSTESQ